MPTTSLWPLEASALTCPLLPGFCSNSSTHMPTASSWSLQAPAFTCSLPAWTLQECTLTWIQSALASACTYT